MRGRTVSSSHPTLLHQQGIDPRCLRGMPQFLEQLRNEVFSGTIQRHTVCAISKYITQRLAHN